MSKIPSSNSVKNISPKNTNSRTQIHVLHVAETTHGGIEAYWQEIAQNKPKSTKIDLKQSFLYPQIAQNHPKLSTIDQNCAQLTFPNTGRGLKKCWHLARALRHTITTQPIDIIHLHSTFAGLIGRLTLLTTRQRPKIIYCPHGWAFNMPNNSIKTYIYATIERLLTPLTHAIIAISEYELKTAKTKKINPKKLHLIPNAINLKMPTPKPKKWDKNKINLLFVGRFHPAKGADILAELTHLAAAKNTNLYFHIVGGSQAKNEAEPIVFNHKNTTQHGWIDRNNIAPYYAAADAIIIPSRWEAFSLVALEAMRTKKPIFVSPHGALPNFIADNKNGIILPLNNLEESLQIITNIPPHSLAKMGLENYKIFQENYTSDKLHKSLTDLYLTVLKLC